MHVYVCDYVCMYIVGGHRGWNHYTSMCVYTCMYEYMYVNVCILEVYTASGTATPLFLVPHSSTTTDPEVGQITNKHNWTFWTFDSH